MAIHAGGSRNTTPTDVRQVFGLNMASGIENRHGNKESVLLITQTRGALVWRYSEMITRAEAAGYEALMLRVDSTVLGNRLHDRREPLKLPPGLSTANRTTKRAGGASKAYAVLMRARQRTRASLARNMVTGLST